MAPTLEVEISSSDVIAPPQIIPDSLSTLFIALQQEDSVEEEAPKKKKIRIRGKRGGKVFCNVCNSSIIQGTGQTPGAKRHILQHHVKKALFRCSVCQYSSNYDRGHVKAHISRVHGGEAEIEMVQIDKESVAFWMNLCFGKRDPPEAGLLSEGENTKADDVQNKENAPPAAETDNGQNTLETFLTNGLQANPVFLQTMQRLLMEAAQKWCEELMNKMEKQ